MNPVASLTTRQNSVFRHSTRDAGPVVASLALGALLVGLMPRLGLGAALAIAVHVWWTSNTVAHIHLHTPIFRSPAFNRAFSIYLSALTCVPQTIWRQRHFAHHANAPVRHRFDRQLALEVVAIALVAAIARGSLFTAVVPGVALGMLFCQLQGAMEHDASGDSISHYGALYNRLWFNDGHHVEHHARPSLHWTSLPARRVAGRSSVLPPILRFLEIARLLGSLERMALGASLVRRAMIAVHRRALRAVIPRRPRSIAIVGGGLFPRTVLALRGLFPEVPLTVIDASAESIAIARGHLGTDTHNVCFVEAAYDAREHDAHELVIFPLAYVGDRDALYVAGRTRRLVHDWAWRARGDRSVMVSLLLLKRLNVVEPA